jgi:hypothetical protein
MFSDILFEHTQDLLEQSGIARLKAPDTHIAMAAANDISAKPEINLDSGSLHMETERKSDSLDLVPAAGSVAEEQAQDTMRPSLTDSAEVLTDRIGWPSGDLRQAQNASADPLPHYPNQNNDVPILREIEEQRKLYDGNARVEDWLTASAVDVENALVAPTKANTVRVSQGAKDSTKRRQKIDLIDIESPGSPSAPILSEIEHQERPVKRRRLKEHNGENAHGPMEIKPIIFLDSNSLDDSTTNSSNDSTLSSSPPGSATAIIPFVPTAQHHSLRYVPATSNAAMHTYNRYSETMEWGSRAATWGSASESGGAFDFGEYQERRTKGIEGRRDYFERRSMDEPLMIVGKLLKKWTVIDEPINTTDAALDPGTSLE